MWSVDYKKGRREIASEKNDFYIITVTINRAERNKEFGKTKILFDNDDLSTTSVRITEKEKA